jgi:uncharacterized membrane protein
MEKKGLGFASWIAFAWVGAGIYVFLYFSLVTSPYAKWLTSEGPVGNLLEWIMGTIAATFHLSGTAAAMPMLFIVLPFSLVLTGAVLGSIVFIVAWCVAKIF